MRDVVALWQMEQVSAGDIVYAACDLLVAGLNGEYLCMLAAMPATGHADTEIRELLETALAEVGVAYHEKGTPAALNAGLRVMAGRVLSGALTPRALAARAHAIFGHGTLDLAEQLVELDDAYDTVDYIEQSVDELDAKVRAEARRIVLTVATSNASP